MTKTEAKTKTETKTASGLNPVPVRPVLDYADLLEAFERVAIDFCESINVDSLTEATQTQFSACCDQIREKIINPSKRYLTKSEQYNQVGDTCIRSNHNIYDVNKLEYIYNIFLQFSSKYDKVPTLSSFCRLCGINSDTFYKWLYEYDSGDDVSRRRISFVKRLKESSESGIREQLLTGRKNAVGLLGVANHDHGWNLPGVSREPVSRPALVASELPVFDRLDSMPSAQPLRLEDSERQ